MKALAFALAALILLACSGCGAAGNAPREGQRTEPPDLTVRAGDRSFTAWRGSYGWGWLLNNGETRWVMADATTWTTEGLDTLSVPAASEAALDFEGVPATEVSATYRRFDDPNTTLEGPQPEGGTLRLPVHTQDLVVELHAAFEQGDCYYAFKMEGDPAAAMMPEGGYEAPPDLTVRAGEIEIIAMRLSYDWAVPLGNGEVMHQAAQAAAPEDVLDILPSLSWAAAFALESLLDARILTAELWPAARGSAAASLLAFDGLTLAPEAISEASVAVIQLGFEQGTCTYAFKVEAP